MANYFVSKGRSIQLQDGTLAQGGRIVSDKELGIDRPNGSANIAGSIRCGFIVPMDGNTSITLEESLARKDAEAYTDTFSKTRADSGQPVFLITDLQDLDTDELNVLISEHGAGLPQESKAEGIKALLSIVRPKDLAPSEVGED